MSTLTAPKTRKLPVWRTVGACYVFVARNLGQLARISWLWLLVMIPVYAAMHWLDRNWQWEYAPIGVILAPAFASAVAELPFLASIAVAWHRLVLREERVAAPAYLRLDGIVWRYALYSLGLMLLVAGAALSLGLPAASLLSGSEPPLPHLAALAPGLAIVVLVLPRLSLVLPAAALGLRPELEDAWRMTRGNTLRLAAATGLCMLPAILLYLLPSLLILVLRAPWWLDFSWDRIVGLMWVTTAVGTLLYWVMGSLGYAVLESLAYALLTTFAVTLLSLAYRFFADPHTESPPPPAVGPA